jgi:hypothetical protein
MMEQGGLTARIPLVNTMFGSSTFVGARVPLRRDFRQVGADWPEHRADGANESTAVRIPKSERYGP